MEFEAVLFLVVLVIWLIWSGLRAFFRWATGTAQREQEEEQRQQEEQRRLDEERERQEAAERQSRAEAKKQFDQAVMDGQFPPDEVLSVLNNNDWDISESVKEALEDLLWVTYVPQGTTYGEAVRLIRQRWRAEERARRRAARAGKAGDDLDRPLTEIDACTLLGVAQGCTPEELATAYRRKMLMWHPDRLENMANELKDFATRRTARINEAYQILKPMAAHRVHGE